MKFYCYRKLAGNTNITLYHLRHLQNLLGGKLSVCMLRYEALERFGHKTCSRRTRKNLKIQIDT